MLLLKFTNRETIRTVKVTDMNPLQSFLTNAPVRDTFNPFAPIKNKAPDLSDLTPKARSSWQDNRQLHTIYKLEDDKEVFLYQKDRFVFQPSKSLTQQWGNLPEGPLVNPSFPNHPTETFLRPPEGLSLTAKQRPLRNYKKEPGMFELIPGDLPPPVPKEFISMDTITQRSIKDQVYSDGVPRQGVAMDMATELHRNQGLTQGLGQLLRQFQNMPAAIAGELAPLIPGQVMMAPGAGGSQYSLSQGVPSEMSFGSGISGLFGPDAKSIEKLAEDVSINAAKDRIVELQNMNKNDFKKNAREIAKLLGVGINLKLDSENDTIKNLQEQLSFIERLKEDRAKAQSEAGSRRSSLASSIGDEKEVSPLAKAQFEAGSLRGSLASSVRDEKGVSPSASPQKTGAATQAIKDMEQLKSSVTSLKLEDVYDQAKIRELLKVLQSAGYVTSNTDIDTLNKEQAALIYTLAKGVYDKATSPKAASPKAPSSKAASPKAASPKAASPKASEEEKADPMDYFIKMDWDAMPDDVKTQIEYSLASKLPTVGLVAVREALRTEAGRITLLRDIKERHTLVGLTEYGKMLEKGNQSDTINFIELNEKNIKGFLDTDKLNTITMGDANLILAALTNDFNRRKTSDAKMSTNLYKAMLIMRARTENPDYDSTQFGAEIKRIKDIDKNQAKKNIVEAGFVLKKS